MQFLLSLQGLTYTTADGRTLFANLDLAFGRERTGLVGANGIGKTTLLKLLTGELSPGGGKVMRSGDLKMLHQDLVPGPADSIADAFGVRLALAEMAGILSGETAFDADMDVDWTLEARMAEALARIGLPALEPDHLLGALSGGQRTRVALAALLFYQPDMIILDEPTNNLDQDGRAAVARVLGDWRGGAVVVSHDRGLLRQMDRIVEISSLGVQTYGGNWDFYQEQKQAERAAADATLMHAEKQLGETARKIQTVKERKARSDSRGQKSRAKGGMPKILMNARRDRAESTSGHLANVATHLQEDARAAVDAARQRVEQLKVPSVKLPSTGLAAGRNVLELESVTGGYDSDAPILSGLSLKITGPERIALVGPNGSGKTTLLRLMTGDMAPLAGTVRRPGTQALLDQHVGILDRQASIRDNFRRLNPKDDETACRAALARFLFRADAALQTVGALSGGEMLRAGLACVLGSGTPPELLLLDEPTNHLDLPSIAAIEAGLKDYDGALVVSSHDADFLAAIGIAREIRLPVAHTPMI